MERLAMKVPATEQTTDVGKKLSDADKLIARYTGTTDPVRQLKLARTLFTKGALLIQTRRFAEALAAFELLLHTFHDSHEQTLQPQIAKTLLDRAAVLDILGRRDEANNSYGELIARFMDSTDDAVRGYVASAMFNKATLLMRMQRPQEALAALNNCLDASVKLPARLLAKALWMKVEALEDSGRDNESLAACERLIAEFADKKEIVDQNWLCQIMLEKVSLLISLDRAVELIQAYQAAEERFGPVAEEVMGAKTSESLVKKLNEHLELNRMTEALTLAEKSLGAFGAFVDPPWFEVAHTAGKARLIALCKLGRVNACIAAYDTVVEKYQDTLTPAMRREVAAMLLDQSTALASRRDYAGADRLCDQLIQRFKPGDDPELATLAARAMFNKIALKAYLGNSDEIMAACDAFVDRFRYSTHPVICEMLFHAWSRKAAALETQHLDADAVLAYDAAIKAGKSLPLPPLPVATIMANKAGCLRRLSRQSEELEALDELVQAFADNTAPGVRAVVVPALLARAFMLREAGRMDDALASCGKFINLVERATPAAMLVPLARAMFLRGEILEKLGREDEAAAAYAALAGRFDFNGETESRKCIPVALFNQAALLEKTLQHQAALRVLDQFLTLARSEPDLIPARLIAQAMRNRGAIFEKLHDIPAAMAAYAELVAAFGAASDAVIMQRVRESLFRRAELLRSNHQIEESLAAYQAIIARGAPVEAPGEPTEILSASSFGASALLARLGKLDAALPAYDAAVSQFGDNADQWVKNEIATALATRMKQAYAAGDFDVALADGKNLKDRFEADQAPEIQKWLLGSAEVAADIEQKKQALIAAAELAEKERETAARQEAQQPQAVQQGQQRDNEIFAEDQSAAPQERQKPAPAAAATDVTAGADVPAPVISPIDAKGAASPQQAPPVVDRGTPQALPLEFPDAHTQPVMSPPADVTNITEPAAADAASAADATETASSGDDLQVRPLVHLRNLKWQGRGEELLAACDTFINHYGTSESIALRREAAEALRMKIEYIKETGSLEDELRACNAFMLQFGREIDPVFAPLLCRTMLDRGRVFGQMDRPGHEAAAYDALILRYGNVAQKAVAGDVAAALTRQAAIAGQQGRVGDEVRCYQKLVGKFGSLPEPEMQREVAAAMLNTALAFRRLDRKLDELAVYDAIIQRFEKTEDTGIVFIVARAMMRKALTQGERGKRHEQIAVCDEIIARFAGADSVFLRQQAARSQCNRALALAELGKIPEAIAACDQVVKSFEDSKELPLRACAGVALFQKAQLLRQHRHRTQAIACYQHLIQSYPMDDEEITGLISQSESLLRVL
jgi:tetratricopeptide (TPR) repeat protein